jgi:hypothetical protein
MHRNIVYVPTLHACLAPPDLPSGILFAGADIAALRGGAASPAGVLEGLPFTPAEAASVLREMLELGLTLTAGGALGELAGREVLAREEAGRNRFSPAEEADLAAFAAGAGVKAAEAGDLLEEERKKAHKVLLLAWEHENGVMEINALERKIAENQARLASSLGEGGEESLPEAFPAESLQPDYSWRGILEALGVFLPPELYLFSAHQGLCGDLKSGASFFSPPSGELPPEFACRPEGFTSGLLWAKEPLWRILNYPELPPDKPWLCSPRDFFIKGRGHSPGF